MLIIRQLKLFSLKLQSSDIQNNHKELARQFFIIDLCEIASTMIIIVLCVRFIIPNFIQDYFVLRGLLRTLNILFQSFIPVVTLKYNSNAMKKLKNWKLGLFGKRKVNNSKIENTIFNPTEPIFKI